jgi:hypothetical protein
MINSNSIVEFNTEKVKGLFISVPHDTIVEECHIKDKESMRFVLMVCFGKKNLIPSWTPIIIPEGNYKIMGLSNELTEKQISEEIGLTYHEYLRLLEEKVVTVNYSDFSNYWLVVVLN